jgi:hypothetical protein
MAQDYQASHGTDWTKPAVGAFAITASASALAHCTRGIYVGTSGDLTVTMKSGESVEFVGLAAGVIHPIACTHVTAITTAADVLGVY